MNYAKQILVAKAVERKIEDWFNTQLNIQVGLNLWTTILKSEKGTVS